MKATDFRVRGLHVTLLFPRYRYPHAGYRSQRKMRLHCLKPTLCLIASSLSSWLARPSFSLRFQSMRGNVSRYLSDMIGAGPQLNCDRTRWGCGTPTKRCVASRRVRVQKWSRPSASPTCRNSFLCLVSTCLRAHSYFLFLCIG